MDNPLELAQRIHETIKQGRETGKTQVGLARACGVSSAAVALWSKTGQITEKNLETLAKYYGVNANWLRTGDAEIQAMSYVEKVPDGYSSIPAYELRLGANNCATAEPEWEEIHNVTPVILPDSIFQAAGVSPSRCRQAIVCGDSMEPFLMDGDKVVFHAFRDSRPGVNSIVDGRIYVISVDGAYRVKRLYKLKDGLQVVSDNPRINTETFIGEECDRLRVYGRVIYVAREGI